MVVSTSMPKKESGVGFAENGVGAATVHQSESRLSR